MSRLFTTWSVLLGLAVLTGCVGLRNPYRNAPAPAEAGPNSRDLIDLPAQRESGRLLSITRLVQSSEEVRRAAVAQADAADPGRRLRPPKNVPCLSGGGAYGAFSAGLFGLPHGLWRPS